MPTCARALTLLLLAALGTAACGDDESQPLSTGATVGLTTGPGGSGSTGPSATGGPSTETGPGADTEEPGSQAVCQRYLTCIAAVAPGGLPQAQMGFGESGSCWQGSEAEAQLCLDACQSGLEMYNEAFPEETACGLCQAHSECDMDAGELCHLGKCTVTTCSDGVVDEEEICDSQPGCDADCQGPQECNPLSGYDCGSFDVCVVRDRFDPKVLDAYCQDEGVAGGAYLGEACGFTIGKHCGPGLGCASKELDPSCEATENDGCCQVLCDLGALDTCEMGRSCVLYQENNGRITPPELGFLGVCVPG